MKKKFTIFAILVLFASSLAFSAPLGGSTLLGAPAATVNLIRNKAITTAELDARVAEYQAAGLEMSRDQVLDVMINDEVFLQGAERDGIEITDQMLDSVMAQQRQSIEQQVGQSLTDEQYYSLVQSQTGMSYSDFRDNAREQLLVQQYLMQEKGEEIQESINNLQISDSAINTYYRRNRQSFYSPENVRLSHIFIEKTGDEATDSANASLLIDVAEQIRTGKTTFERAVQQYSEDESKSIGGDIGWLTLDNTVARQGLGDDFVDTVVAMDAGEISGMIESNIGYHVVRISVHNDGKILALDDRINPEENVTLREYIRQILIQNESNTLMNNALNDLISELRNQARIRKY